MGCRTQGDGQDPRTQDVGYWAEMSPHIAGPIVINLPTLGIQGNKGI